MKEGKSKSPLSHLKKERSKCYECMAVCGLYAPGGCLFERIVVIWSKNREKAED
ncbi:hypothetical protein ACQGS6_07330 [Bacillus sp. GMs2/2]|uniref:hypothetical protein n=1 Tax=Bacillus sp. GMs2/2 TaxID=3418494 RepID=UPI003CEFBC31